MPAEPFAQEAEPLPGSEAVLAEEEASAQRRCAELEAADQFTASQAQEWDRLGCDDLLFPQEVIEARLYGILGTIDDDSFNDQWFGDGFGQVGEDVIVATGVGVGDSFAGYEQFDDSLEGLLDSEFGALGGIEGSDSHVGAAEMEVSDGSEESDEANPEFFGLAVRLELTDLRVSGVAREVASEFANEGLPYLLDCWSEPGFPPGNFTIELEADGVGGHATTTITNLEGGPADCARYEIGWFFRHAPAPMTVSMDVAYEPGSMF